MKFTIRIILVLIFILTFCSPESYAQYSSKKVKSKYETYTDSLKQVDYHYVFPILGKGAYKKGFDIPYPIGIMANSIWMKQDLIFSNFQLGFENEGTDIPLQPADFIQFGENSNNSQNYTVRPDIWIFPFLNVYGLFGAGTSKTSVNLVAPINLSTEVDQDFRTNGFGVMAAGGVGPIWLSLDFNWTWNKPKLLDAPVKVSIIGLRLGHTFVFKQNPKRNFAIWIGGMRAKMASETSGQIKLNEAIPNFEENKDQIVSDYDAWRTSSEFDDLTPVQKVVVHTVVDPIIESIDASDGEGIVKYAMDKQTKEKWNGLVGAQFQLNKHFQFRSEAGVVGNRKSFLFSVNYRFLL